MGLNRDKMALSADLVDGRVENDYASGWPLSSRDEMSQRSLCAQEVPFAAPVVSIESRSTNRRPLLIVAIGRRFGSEDCGPRIHGINQFDVM